jgi:type II secretory pathway component GspD/PulD (secretin)
VAEEPTSQTHQGETTTTTSFNEYVEAGTVFKVTPQITEGDYLHMDYQINLSSFGQKADSSLPPSRSKSEMISSTTVPDGYTIVLGGIQTTNESKSVHKVPLLGDIPLMGLLFRNTVVRKKYITTYLFVTASIMKDEDFGDLRNRSSDALQEVDNGQNPEP